MGGAEPSTVPEPKTESEAAVDLPLRVSLGLEGDWGEWWKGGGRIFRASAGAGSAEN